MNTLPETKTHSALPIILGLFVALFFSGCMHMPTPYLPDDWNGTPIEITGTQDGDNDKLSIFVIYGAGVCAHTTMRIYSPEHGVLFWDPAGGFGDPEYVIQGDRDRDMLVNPVPTIAEYLEFRREIDTVKLEIFEFTITPEQALHLMTLLKAQPGGDEEYYPTKAAVMKCAASISDFLEKHAGEIFEITAGFYPHALAEQLYEKKPDRVIVWDLTKMLEYIPPE